MHVRELPVKHVKPVDDYGDRTLSLTNARLVAAADGSSSASLRDVIECRTNESKTSASGRAEQDAFSRTKESSRQGGKGSERPHRHHHHHHLHRSQHHQPDSKEPRDDTPKLKSPSPTMKLSSGAGVSDNRALVLCQAPPIELPSDTSRPLSLRSSPPAAPCRLMLRPSRRQQCQPHLRPWEQVAT